MRKELSDYILDWFSKADEDLLTATRLFRAEDPMETANSIGFHCQQSIEKYLKAYLVSQEISFQKIHDLEMLQLKCSSIDSSYEQFDFKNLTDYGVKYRYPDWEHLQINEQSLRDFISIADELKLFVRTKIELYS